MLISVLSCFRPSIPEDGKQQLVSLSLSLSSYRSVMINGFMRLLKAANVGPQIAPINYPWSQCQTAQTDWLGMGGMRGMRGMA